MTTANGNFTQELGQQVSAFRSDSFTDEEYGLARVAVADLLCVTVAGVSEPVSQIVRQLVDEMGGAEQATLIGGGKKVSALQAAKVNGTTAHALDFDDTLQPMQGHPSASLLPALFALAERNNKSYADVLTSYLVGLEAGCIISESLGVEHYYVGWHGTATIGRIATAAACSHMLGLDAPTVSTALAIAGTEASGVKQSFGTMCKPYHAGMAAEGGLNAALLASLGMSAAPDLLEGRLGFIRLHNGENAAVSGAFLKGRRPVQLLAHKFHAACHNTHASIELLLNWIEDENLKAGEVSSIEVYTSQIGVDNAGKEIVKSGLDGKFSIPYTIARTLLTQETGVSGYTDEAATAADAQAFMKKVTLIVDDEHREGALRTSLKVKRANGTELVGSFDPMDHIPDLESKRKRVTAKFHGLCDPILGASQTKELLDMVLGGEENTLAESIVKMTA